MKKIVTLVLGFILGALAMYYYSNQSLGESEAIVKPKGVITPAEAKTLDQAFNTRHELISDSIVKRPDNRSSWWSLEDMRDYLNYAEKESLELGYTMNGVRVYLGAYPTDKEVGYTTMFMVPTGNLNVSEGNMTLINYRIGDPQNIPGGSGFNKGADGNPPNANYTQ
ncbi:hypothetical protein [Ichthyenterobacterium magnum]|uniref:DUF4830 domain-containing protein n=1 Tax=Ichthyenterobacterium magnum TaxID=1230530 RepID=A0A420DLT5_9FLAO|nr:hypothetical protein [Ichthyenterobacterium magnum]RKE95155.1 hypothetical protein BXY80_1340 [Ichthyenterobacterium magnum]